MSRKLRVLIMGAHPDDAELGAGGLAVKLVRKGHEVKIVAVTDGSAGGYKDYGPPLAKRRKKEMEEAARVIGCETQMLDNQDGYLQPDCKTRDKIIKTIREWNPDLILTHRPYDYHPDHRYTGTLLIDSSYLIKVPAVCREVPPLRYSPVILFMHDRFTKPCPFEPDVVIDIGDAIEDKAKAVSRHASQFGEWNLWAGGDDNPVPLKEEEILERMLKGVMGRGERIADSYREMLIDAYGAQRGGKVKYAEAFEVSEHAGQLDPEIRKILEEL